MSAVDVEGVPGVTSTFESACDELFSLAYRVAYPVVGQRETAQDVAQESLARAYARWARIEDYAPAWVCRVALNLALDTVKRKRPPVRPPEPQDADPHLADRLDLQQALRRLPKRQREALVLRYVLDLSEAEVAGLLGVRAGTVKTHLARGLAAMRTTIGDRSGEDAR